MNETVIIISGLITLMSTVSLFIVSSRYLRLKNNFSESMHAATEKAKRAIQAKETFLANISHETRTPMNAIIGLSHILLQSDLNDEQKTNLFKIKRSAEHLLTITNDILDYSKLEAGKLTLESIPIDSGNFFNGISDILAPMAIDKHLDLIFDITPDLPESWEGDPLRLTQILLNLLNNAIKFTEKGYVTLRVTTPTLSGRPVLHFAVEDSGIGLTEAQRDVLFNAFSQADNSISRKFGGTGLGLTISAELALMMGSKIDVESHYNEGSIFSFTLPLQGAEPREEKREELSRRLMEEKSILVADLSDANAKTLTGILMHFHARAKIAETASELVRLLEGERYDAICIDSRMLTQIDLKRLHQQCDTLVVLQYDLLPGNTVKQAAPDAILHKPFTPLSVQSTMTEIFGKAIAENSVTKKHVGFDDILLLNGSRILLAEDNEGNVMVVSGLLDSSGIELVHAPNGQRAVEKLLKDSKGFDLVLMDINMPVMDGYTAASIIREYQKYDDLPIIAMTANITEGDMNKTKSLGMQDFIGKPIDVEQFYTVLLKYIKPKRRLGDVRPMKAEPESARKPTSDSPDIPGLNTEAGLARVNGNRTAYMNILKKYTELFSDIVPKLHDAVERDAFEDGRAAAHNLKGLSGNIGAEALYTLAADIEVGFKEKHGNLPQQIDMLETKITPLFNAITLLEKQMPDKDTGEKEAITPAALSGILESLRESAVRKKAIEIKQGCNALKSYQFPAQQQQNFEKLVANVERYRYDKIVQYIDAILKGL